MIARRAVLLDTIRNNSRFSRADALPSLPPPPPPSFCFCWPFARPRTLPPITMPVSRNPRAGAGLCFSCPPAAAVGFTPWFWGALSTPICGKNVNNWYSPHFVVKKARNVPKKSHQNIILELFSNKCRFLG
jgi:hypothetical protein